MDNISIQEYEYYMKNRPHVVILGAGASCAAIPNGDKNGRKISAMSGFIDKLGFRKILNEVVDHILYIGKQNITMEQGTYNSWKFNKTNRDNNEIEQKYKWLNENYPKIKRENMFFINSTMLKPEVIIEYSRHFNIPLDKIVFVDDRLDVLRKAEEYGIASYHPSSFME